MIVIKNRRCDNLDIPRQMSKVADADRPRRTLTSLTPDPSPSVVPVIIPYIVSHFCSLSLTVSTITVSSLKKLINLLH